MKKLAQLMDELGFDPEGSPAVKEAFIKYLIKSSQNVNVLTPTEKHLVKASPEVRPLKALAVQHSPTNQMQFDFMSVTSPKPVKQPKTS
jgi:hypothetical protein